MHVHVHHSDGEAKFWIDPQIELAHNWGLSDKHLREARELIEEHCDEIRRAGKPTSAVEVTNISTHGFWLLLSDRELFVPFAEFPWFKDASVGAVLKVELPSPGHLYWPDLDIDLAVESIEHPERFPLISRSPVPIRPSSSKS